MSVTQFSLRDHSAKFLFEITNQDLRFGRRKHYEACPLALCLLESGYVNVGVGRQKMLFNDSNFEYEITNPKVLQDWIARFDANQPVKEIRFQISAKVRKKSEDGFAESI